MSLRSVCAALLLAAALLPSLACDGKVKLPDLPKVDLPSVPLPKLGAGKLLLIEASRARVELDPTVDDALTALGACTDLVTYCYAPGERSLDQCVEAAPACASARPWEEDAACCPKACASAYEKARKGGAAPLDALEQTFFLAPDCFPGVRALLEAEQ